MIGGALVGTFLGVFVAYGFFGPMAQSLRNIYEAEAKYFLSMKVGPAGPHLRLGAGHGHRIRPQGADVAKIGRPSPKSTRRPPTCRRHS